MIKQALILASGKGTRMKPITDTLPKPLVKINDITMLDRIIKHVENAGIEKIVINTFHLSEVLENHIKNLNNPKIIISHENEFMENGGAVVNALQYLDDEPFITINSDTIWFEDDIQEYSNLQRLMQEFNPEKDDILMMLKKVEEFNGYRAHGDFDYNSTMQTISRPHGSFERLPYAFIGAQAINPRIFKNKKLPELPFNFNYFYFNSDTWQKTDGLLKRIRGIEHTGDIFHVGKVEDIKDTEDKITNLKLEQ